VPVVVFATQAHQFLTAQSAVVGHEHHGPIAGRFLGDDVEDDPLPDRGRGEPRQASSRPYGPALWCASEMTDASAWQGVEAVTPKARSDQVVVELPQRDHVLGDGGFGETSAREGDGVVAESAG